MPDRIPERYEPTAIVGLGGQGHVIHAWDRRHERAVAIKVRRFASDAERSSVLAEAGTLLKIEPHPNLPLAREDFFVGDRYCIVMDWIEGQSLADILSVHPDGLDEDLVLAALDQVADALDHMHSHDPPVIHLDVKPANIVRRNDGRFVLVDLGLSGRGPMPYAGTPAYAAPELASRTKPTAAADVFSLAVTAFELLTGDVPVPGAGMGGPSLGEGRREQLFSALRRGLATDPTLRPRTAPEFVALLKPTSAPNNLPARVSSFVGRARELSDIKRLLHTARCLTLTGSGGIGKTTLALEAARESLGAFAGGVTVLELASLQDGGALAAYASSTLGLTDSPGMDAEDVVASALMAGRQLFILDNCEHVINDCALFAERLLRACPDLTIMATSREALRIDGETVWRTPAMDVPTPGALDQHAAEAVQLFMDRAKAADPSIALSAADADTVAALTRSLEGIPLAIELAAARLRDLPLSDIASSLDSALSVLREGPRTRPRHETLRAALAWSYRLLTDREQQVFAQLSVFVGFSPEAAALVCGRVVDEEIVSLVQKSLCERVEVGTGQRYRMLETIRQYAAEHLIARGEVDRVRGDHLDWCTRLAEDARSELAGPEQKKWLDRLSTENENLRSALTYGTSAAPGRALALAVALSDYWQIRGHWHEGRSALERCIATDAPPGELLAWGLRNLGVFARQQGDLAVARDACERGFLLFEQAGNDDGRAAAINDLGAIAYAAGDIAAARTDWYRALEVERRRGDRHRQCALLNNLGTIAANQGDFAEAKDRLQDALAIARELGDRRHVGWLLANLGVVAVNEADSARAEALFVEALAVGRDLGDSRLAAFALETLAMIAMTHENHDRAVALFDEALGVYRELGSQPKIVDVMSVMSEPLATTGDMDRATALADDAVSLSRELGLKREMANALHQRAKLARGNGSLDHAAEDMRECLDLYLDLGDRQAIARATETISSFAARSGDPDAAAVLLGIADGIRDSLGAPRQSEGPLRHIPAVRKDLGEDSFDRARQRGVAMTLPQAVAFATSWCTTPLPDGIRARRSARA